jgi:hypothetical protein
VKYKKALSRKLFSSISEINFQFQIRDKKWENTGSRACYLRKSATALEVGNNDYSELGLLQQQHQAQVRPVF